MENPPAPQQLPADCKVVLVERTNNHFVFPWWALMVVLILISAVIALGVHCYNLKSSFLAGTSPPLHEVIPVSIQEDESNNDSNSSNHHTANINAASEAYIKDISGLVFPNSSVEYLTNNDLAFLQNYELESKKIIIQMAINELYARHGFLFGKDDVREYYSRYSWYCGTKSMEAARQEFNDIEKWNADFLVSQLGAIS